VEFFQKAADQGNAKAQMGMGLAYLEGNGIELDYDKAAEFFRLAADQGLADAKDCLELLKKFEEKRK